MPKLNGILKIKELMAEETYLIGLKIDKYLNPRNGSFYSFKVADKTFRSYSLVFAQNKDIKNKPKFITNDIEINDETTILYFLIATKGEGVGANYIKNLKLEEETTLIGDAGKFGLSGDLNKPKIFVGTGTGLAPFVGMSHELLESGFNKEKLVILAGLKGTDGNWIKKVLSEGINLMSCFYPNKEVLEEKEANELVTETVKKMIKEGMIEDGSEFYLCGHPRMVADVEELILSSKKEFYIYKEKFSI